MFLQNKKSQSFHQLFSNPYLTDALIAEIAPSLTAVAT